MKATTETGLRLVIEDELLSEIENIGLKHSPKEYGGFLLGYYADDFKTLTITDILLPNNYKSTFICFERKSAGLEEAFIKYYNKTPSQYYVGEWHTHPNGQPLPSMLDEITIKGIAQNKTIAINNPVMLIIGYNKDKANSSFYVLSKNKLHRYG